MTCKLCDLCITRKNVVLGIGNETADIMLIGDAPGYQEDKQGVPFIGDGGKYIRDELAKLSLNESNMFMTNVIKCRPPKNREPHPSEIEVCTTNFLGEEINYINPVFIITAGKVATVPWLGEVSMHKVIGNYYEIADKIVLPIYHPSYIMRDERRRPMYVELLTYVRDTIAHISYVNAFELAAHFNKTIKSPF